MLYRPYPPDQMLDTVSHLGGLPALPVDMEWPRASDGTAFHFLACIDLSELPENSELPASGVLFFFARVDDEMLWSEDGDDPKDYSRVIYAPSPARTECAAPDDLGSIEGGWSNFERHFHLPDEKRFATYPRWPLLSKRIESWPDIEALSETPEGEYERLERARVDEAARAVAITVPTKADRANWGDIRRKLVLPQDDDHPFPQLWVMIDRISRYMVTQLSPENTDAADRDAATSALAWVKKAAQHDLADQVDAEIAAEFKDWMQGLWVTGQYSLSDALYQGMQSSLQFVAQDPQAAARFPKSYYKEMQAEHMPVVFDSGGGAPEPRHHQMLGHPRSEQEPPPIERDKVLLAQFFSDYGVEFMFCDVGVAEFWINATDLKHGRFDRAWATTDGG